MMKYETVVGLEVHVELSTNTKIFCSCANEFGGEPNTHACPICTGMPGVLPVMNEKVVEYAAKAGLALSCEVANFSKMDRKGYYYPDLPKAYQISQFDLPICNHGKVTINTNGEQKDIRILRIHMEEDAGKLIHEGNLGSKVDYNRCGVPLIEIVTEPDMRSADEAKDFLDKLKSIMEYIGVSDCKMQEGSLRCDVNVSVRPEGQKELGTRCEMKNVNSFSSAYKSIIYESKRQIELIEDGEKVIQQTRRWDDDKGKTFAMRGKEEAHDYRYFPDPDLVPVVLTDEQILGYKDSLPELPEAKLQRYVDTLGLSQYDAGVLTSSKYIADYFETAMGAYDNPKKLANWVMGDLLSLLKDEGTLPEDMDSDPMIMVEALKLVDDGVINVTVGKNVFEQSYKSGKSPSQIVEEKGLKQISDTGELERMVKQIVAANPKPVADYKAGNKKALTFFVGQMMKATKGKANPKVVNELVLKEIDSI
jgi:aspartyl-tRNA(Asn)/glutamyl-tRNA(Gln) amidotransferase subunit B